MPENLAAANRRLLLQVAELSGDDHIRREVAPWRDASPAERIAACLALSRAAWHHIEQLDDDEAERALAAEPLPGDTVRLLESWWRSAGR